MSRGPRTYDDGVSVRLTAMSASGQTLQWGLASKILSSAARPGQGIGVNWFSNELPAAVRVDVVDDHDADSSTAEVVVGHWTVGLAPPQLAGLPQGADPTTTEPLFAAPGSADEVAQAYLQDRFPDYPAPNVMAEPASHRGRRAFVRWSTGDDGDGGNGQEIATGWLALRETDGFWAVEAATTDGVDLSGLRVSDGRVHGRITTQDHLLYADIFQPDLTPAAGSPLPEGQPGAAYRYGTAGGPGTGSLDIDVEVEPGSAIVRVNLVGGTILSISEIRLQVPNP